MDLLFLRFSIHKDAAYENDYRVNTGEVVKWSEAKKRKRGSTKHLNGNWFLATSWLRRWAAM